MCSRNQGEIYRALGIGAIDERDIPQVVDEIIHHLQLNNLITIDGENVSLTSKGLDKCEECRRKDYSVRDILDLINHYYGNQLVADHSVQDICTADIAKKDYGGINNNLRKILQHDKKIIWCCIF